MGLFDGAAGVGSEVADTLGINKESAKQKAFKRDFNKGDFDEFGGDVNAGQFSTIASYDVPASTEISWGYGKANNPENQGYLYVDLQNATPAAVEGTLRLAQESPTGRRTLVVADFDTTTLDASKSDRTQRIPLPEQVDKPVVTQDSRIVVQLKPTADDTVDEGQSDVIFPVTEYDLSEQ